MAAIAAGSVVIPGAEYAPLGEVLRPIPFLGVVESSGGGSPPATVVVAWENGTRVSYAVTQPGSGAPTLLGLAPPTNASIQGSIVDPVPGIPNPGGKFRGVVVLHLSAVLPDGTASGDIVMVKTKIGFYVLPFIDVAVVPNA
jgi:hypothetical protein